MPGDVPCCCVNCGLVYADARALVFEDRPRDLSRPPETFLSPGNGNRFRGLHCRGCNGLDYRLLSGPLFVPRPEDPKP